MKEELIWERLAQVFRDVFDDEVTIGPATTALDVVGWDSLSNIQLLVAIEKAFPGVRFNTGQIASLRNVGEMVAIIRERIRDYA
jgi:acyl carrier protein